MLPAGPALGDLVAYHLMTGLKTSIQKPLSSIRLHGLAAARLVCSATFLNVVIVYITAAPVMQAFEA